MTSAPTPIRCFGYLRHVGFDGGAINHSTEILQASLRLYRLKNGTNEVERSCIDLATSRPITAMIENVLRQKARAARKVRSLAK